VVLFLSIDKFYQSFLVGRKVTKHLQNYTYFLLLLVIVNVVVVVVAAAVAVESAFLFDANSD
jgi:energy-converting hydrogenase Eha subunit H